MSGSVHHRPPRERRLVHRVPGREYGRRASGGTRTRDAATATSIVRWVRPAADRILRTERRKVCSFKGQFLVGGRYCHSWRSRTGTADIFWHPEQNGRHARMHRTLKAETARPPRRTFTAQQRAFDSFLHDYNHERSSRSVGGTLSGALGGPRSELRPRLRLRGERCLLSSSVPLESARRDARAVTIAGGGVVNNAARSAAEQPSSDRWCSAGSSRTP